MSCVHRYAAIGRPELSFVTVASHTCVVRPRCSGVARPLTISPSRADDRKLAFDSTDIVDVALAEPLVKGPMAIPGASPGEALRVSVGAQAVSKSTKAGPKMEEMSERG